jgi:hypothetical protein
MMEGHQCSSCGQFWSSQATQGDYDIIADVCPDCIPGLLPEATLELVHLCPVCRRPVEETMHHAIAAHRDTVGGPCPAGIAQIRFSRTRVSVIEPVGD